MINFGKSHGYEFVTVQLGDSGDVPGLPAGAAIVSLPPDSSVTEVVGDLKGKLCERRPVRVENADGSKRRNSKGKDKNRYFGDITCKCPLCGEVGHRQNDCMNDPIPTPCHLCAGGDHDSGWLTGTILRILRLCRTISIGSCPNIACFRCGQFGHHSRDCYNGYRPRLQLCTICGRNSHNSSNCIEGTVPQILSPGQQHYYNDNNQNHSTFRVEGPYIRCMSCNEEGHAMCSKFGTETLKDKKSR